MVIDLTGRTFERLTVIERGGTHKSGKALWRCLCSCGGETTVNGAYLRNGDTRSCGCLAREAIGDRRRVDGRSRHPLHSTWGSMKCRCLKVDHRSYPNYGGRGISIYPEWVDDFAAFATWIDVNLGSRPEGLSLDRIDNDGNYEPGNLRWASATEQNANQRRIIRNTEYDALRSERDLWRDRALALGWQATE